MSKLPPLLKLGPAIRWKHCYRVPEAGKRRGWSRSEAYRQAAAGNIVGLIRFTDTKIKGVRKRPFDADTERLLKAAR
jgi:hypothetical protein